MRLKFEKLPAELIPGTTKREDATSSRTGDDVDLVTIVERLRNVPKPQQQAMASPKSSTRAARPATRTTANRRRRAYHRTTISTCATASSQRPSACARRTIEPAGRSCSLFWRSADRLRSRVKHPRSASLARLDKSRKGIHQAGLNDVAFENPERSGHLVREHRKSRKPRQATGLMNSSSGF